jgi:hypothetical protein
MTKLRVTFVDSANVETSLSYNIYNTHLSKKWIDITKENLSNPDCVIYSVLSNYDEKSIPKLYERLRQITIGINKLQPKQLPLFDVYNTAELNYMHEEFENYGRVLEGSNAKTSLLKTALNQSLNSIELRNLYFALNETIHNCESAMTCSTKKVLQGGALYDLHPLGLHRELEEEDKLYLISGVKWGGLYLGYNTLGKDWLNIAKDNDVEVVERKMVKPQRRFAAETWLNFGGDASHVESVKTFYNWVNSLPIKLRQNVPIDDLNELTLGRLALGEVIINDVFLRYEPNRYYWQVPNHPCKYKWNTEVFNTFEKIIKIEFYE